MFIDLEAFHVTIRFEKPAEKNRFQPVFRFENNATSNGGVSE